MAIKMNRSPQQPGQSIMNRWQTKLAPSLMIVVVACVCATGCQKTNQADESATTDASEQAELDASVEPTISPSPELTPVEVVKIQVDVLQRLGVDGISSVYQFASPRNRQTIGSVGDFAAVMKSAAYKPIMSGQHVSFFNMEIEGDVAQQVVSIEQNDGTVTFYLFELSRQTSGEFADCWMTDGVRPSAVRLSTS